MDSLESYIDSGVVYALGINSQCFDFTPVNALEGEAGTRGLGACPQSKRLIAAAKLLNIDQDSLARWLCGSLLPSSTAPEECRDKAVVSCACRILQRALLERLKAIRAASEPNLDKLERIHELTDREANEVASRFTDYEVGQECLSRWEQKLRLTGEELVQAVEELVGHLTENGGSLEEGDPRWPLWPPCPHAPEKPSAKTVFVV